MLWAYPGYGAPFGYDESDPASFAARMAIGHFEVAARFMLSTDESVSRDFVRFFLGRPTTPPGTGPGPRGPWIYGEIEVSPYFRLDLAAPDFFAFANAAHRAPRAPKRQSLTKVVGAAIALYEDIIPRLLAGLILDLGDAEPSLTLCAMLHIDVDLSHPKDSRIEISLGDNRTLFLRDWSHVDREFGGHGPVLPPNLDKAQQMAWRRGMDHVESFTEPIFELIEDTHTAILKVLAG